MQDQEEKKCSIEQSASQQSDNHDLVEEQSEDKDFDEINGNDVIVRQCKKTLIRIRQFGNMLKFFEKLIMMSRFDKEDEKLEKLATVGQVIAAQTWKVVDHYSIIQDAYKLVEDISLCKNFICLLQPFAPQQNQKCMKINFKDEKMLNQNLGPPLAASSNLEDKIKCKYKKKKAMKFKRKHN